MEIKSNIIKDIWDVGGIGSCYHSPWSLSSCQGDFSTVSKEGWFGVMLTCGTKIAYYSKYLDLLPQVHA